MRSRLCKIGRNLSAKKAQSPSLKATMSAAGSSALGGASRQAVTQTVRISGLSRRLPKGRPVISQVSPPSSKRSYASTSRQSQEIPRSHLGPLAAKDPFVYDTIRPKPQSTYVALAHRLKLISHKTDAQTQRKRIEALVQACTHFSYTDLIARTKEKYGEDADAGRGSGIIRNMGEGGELSHSNALERTQAQNDAQYLDASLTKSNETLAALGNTILGLIASEFIHLRYPNLPNRVFKAALSAYVGPNTLADVASELGVAAKGVVRWDRPARKIEDMPPKERSLMARLLANKPAPDKLLSRDVHADVLRSIIAVMFQEQVSSHVLSLEVAID